jgi:hypothetical protein
MLTLLTYLPALNFLYIIVFARYLFAAQFGFITVFSSALACATLLLFAAQALAPIQLSTAVGSWVVTELFELR